MANAVGLRSGSGSRSPRAAGVNFAPALSTRASRRQGMDMTFRNWARFAFASLIFAALCGNAAAQDYPSRPVTIIVPVAAGGSIDYLARLIGQKLSDRLGKPVVIENKTGGGMVIGAVAAAKAPPDGYTM